MIGRKSRSVTAGRLFIISIVLESRMGKIIENYALQEIIGEGMYGKVYKAVHLRTKEEFAVKVIPVKKFQENPKLEECTVNEINILSKIEQSPYIIGYVEMLKTPNNFYFIYHYCNGKTLEALLRHETKLSEQRALKIFRQLLEAFKVLNKYSIMHRDLKPDNIFFHNGNLKLGDFGFCKTLGKENDMASTMLGSPIYMAPEVLKGEIYTSKADIWSLGVVLFEMLFGFCPFESNSIAKLISVLQDTELKIPLDVNNISLPCQNLLRRLLVKDQFKRVDWFELLQVDISENGYINEKRGSDTMLDDLKEILSQKQIGGYAVETEDYRKAYDTSSNSSGSKNSNTALRATTQKVTSFEEKPATTGFPYEIKKTSFQQKKPEPVVLRPTEPNQAYSSPPIVKKHSLPASFGTLSKRRNLLEEHTHCSAGIRLAINLLKSEEPAALGMSYLVFQKIEEKLRKLSSAITASDVDVEDISASIANELKQVEKHLVDMKEELQSCANETCQLTEYRNFLKTRFRDRNEHNLKLWYEMVQLLRGERMPTNQPSQAELNMLVNAALA